ncbi:hypothetical protein BGZ98_006590 [Dissophora globulifera]|nr:hypothetical protein BGZ98_006590 [Dissophora globulifera]
MDTVAFSKGESVDATIILLAAEVGIVTFVYVVQGTLQSEFRQILWQAWTGSSRTGCSLSDGAKILNIIADNRISKVQYESKVDIPGYGTVLSTKIKLDLVTVLKHTISTGEKTPACVFEGVQTKALARKFVYPQHRLDQKKVSILWGGGDCDLFSRRVSRGITGYTLDRIRSSYSLISVDEMKWMFVAGGIASRNKGLYPAELICGLAVEAPKPVGATTATRPVGAATATGPVGATTTTGSVGATTDIGPLEATTVTEPVVPTTVAATTGSVGAATATGPVKAAKATDAAPTTYIPYVDMIDEVETTSKWRPRQAKSSRSQYAKESAAQFSGLGYRYYSAVVEIGLLLQDIPNDIVIKALQARVEQRSSEKMWRIQDLTGSMELQEAMYRCQYMTLCAKLNWYSEKNNERPDLLMGLMYATFKGWNITVR